MLNLGDQVKVRLDGELVAIGKLINLTMAFDNAAEEVEINLIKIKKPKKIKKPWESRK